MTDRQKTQIRARLEERATLLSRRAEALDLTLEHCADDTDQATELARHSLDLALRERESAQLREVRSALERMDSPHFGRCEDCGAEIGAARLLARPSTRLCVCCQVEFEQSLSACA